MSSAAQVLANQQNSLHSTGPVTAAGKAASSRNATRHGLTSKSIVIPGEDPAEYDAFRNSVLHDHAPATELEHALAEEIAANGWRLNRARRQETAVLKKLMGNSADPDLAFAEIFLEKPKELNRLLRYITSIERAFYRAIEKLQALQHARRLQEKKSAQEKIWLQNVRNSNSGFVSHTPHTEPRPAGSGRLDADAKIDPCPKAPSKPSSSTSERS